WPPTLRCASRSATSRKRESCGCIRGRRTRTCLRGAAVESAERALGLLWGRGRGAVQAAAGRPRCPPCRPPARTAPWSAPGTTVRRTRRFCLCARSPPPLRGEGEARVCSPRHAPRWADLSGRSPEITDVVDRPLGEGPAPFTRDGFQRGDLVGAVDKLREHVDPRPGRSERDSCAHPLLHGLFRGDLFEDDLAAQGFPDQACPLLIG